MDNPTNGQVSMLGGLGVQAPGGASPTQTHDLDSRLGGLAARGDLPLGGSAAIGALSRAPYYTACPNPWLGEGLTLMPDPPLGAPPSLVTDDIRAGKDDPVYFAHFYPTKVPPAAIVPFLLRFTEPGQVVLDAFCGTGMTGVASQLCGRPEVVAGRGQVGARKALLVDLGVAPAFIAAVTNSIGRLLPHLDAIEAICHSVASRHQGLLSTAHVGWRRGAKAEARKNRTAAGSTDRGMIQYTVWSDVVVCPGCSTELVHWDLVFRGAGQAETKNPRCPKCDCELTPSSMEKSWDTFLDPILRVPVKQARQKPVMINYSVGTTRFEKTPDADDLAALETARNLLSTLQLPMVEMPQGFNTAQPRQSHGLTHAHHFFKERNQVLLAECWRRFNELEDPDARMLGLYVLTGAVQRVCRLNRYMPTHDRHVGPLSGTLYVAPLTAEIPATNYLLDRVTDLRRCPSSLKGQGVRISTQSATQLETIPDCSVDFVFTDPPFGGNLNYSELNILVEAWLGPRTNNASEAIVNDVQEKGLEDYERLMDEAFAEYFRVLKPGRYLVVEFHNTSNAVWMAIQEAIQKAGFSVLNVATLDKVKGTTKQLSYSATTKEDLLITAYKPTHGSKGVGGLVEVGKEELWQFVRERLERLPLLLERPGKGEAVKERADYRLFDRVVAHFVLRGWRVPVTAAEFYAELAERFSHRDGVYFLPSQVAMYDKIRSKSSDFKQLDIFVKDELAAIQWVRRELTYKPRTFGDLQPTFMREATSWNQNERRVELLTILEQNFLCYEGTGPVPSQIHSYLSSNFKELRSLDKQDPRLVEEARDRWYVPDPGKQAERDELRDRALVREFSEYKDAKQPKLKKVRAEAVRAGFKAAYDAGDYQTILAVARKLPESVLQEDEKLLMYYDVAKMRLGAD